MVEPPGGGSTWIALVDPAAVITDDLAVPADVPILDVADFALLLRWLADLPGTSGPHTGDADPAAILVPLRQPGMPMVSNCRSAAWWPNQQNVLVRSRQLPHLLNPQAPQRSTLVLHTAVPRHALAGPCR